MEDCDKLELLWLEGRYLGFIVETNTELNILEHLEGCATCRAKIVKSIEDDEEILGLGSLFQRGFEEEEIPKYGGDPESFMDARIAWRRARLEALLRDAELELEDLRKRL
jgi:hypothetical protein